jgi:hypothetical protein
MYCHKHDPKLSGDFTNSDIYDMVTVRFERCSGPKVKCWSSVKRKNFMRGKEIRVIATKNFIKQENYEKIISS